MTSVTPTITVLLDDGTGTYPTDITSRVNLSSSVNVSGHGRTDEFGQAVATTFTCTLNNNDGHLSNGTIPLSVAQGIRYKQHLGSTTVNRFTGRISEAALGLSATGKASAVVISAVDPLSELARRVTALSSVDQEILTDADGAYYPLTDAAGATKSSDVSGNNQPRLKVSSLDPTNSVTFGTDLGVPDDATGVLFFNSGALSGSPYLEADAGTWTSPSIHANFLLNFTSFGGSTSDTVQLLSLSNSGAGLLVTVSGLGVLATGGHGSFTNALLIFPTPHVVGLNINSTSTDIWVDGVKVSTAAGITTTWDNTKVILGPQIAPNSVVTKLVAGRFTYGAHVSDARMLSEQTALLTDFAGETTAARFTRIAGYAGFTASTPSNSGQTLGAEGPPDGTILDALQTVTAAEGGVMFADGSGTLVMQGRNYRALNATADLTLPGKDIDVGTTVPLDDQQLVNQVTVTTTDGTVQIYENATAITNQGLYAQSLDVPLPDAASALIAAQWIVNKHSTATPRVGTALVKLLTSSQAEQIIQAEIGDRWALSSMPSQLWSGAGDLSLEGWSETLTVGTTNEWSMTANLLPFAIFQAGVWDDTGSRWDSAVWAY